MSEATLKKIQFNEMNGTVWLDKDTFSTLVCFYLEGHPLEVDKIEITVFNPDTGGVAEIGQNALFQEYALNARRCLRAKQGIGVKNEP